MTPACRYGSTSCHLATTMSNSRAEATLGTGSLLICSAVCGVVQGNTHRQTMAFVHFNSMDEDYWMELSMELSLKIPVVACLWSLLSRVKCLSSKWRRRENFKRWRKWNFLALYVSSKQWNVFSVPGRLSWCLINSFYNFLNVSFLAVCELC